MNNTDRKLTDERLEKMMKDIYKTKPESRKNVSSSEINLSEIMRDNSEEMTASGSEKINSKRRININSIVAVCAALAVFAAGAYFLHKDGKSEDDIKPPAISGTSEVTTAAVTDDSITTQDGVVTEETTPPEKAEKKYLVSKEKTVKAKDEEGYNNYIVYKYDENGNPKEETTYNLYTDAIMYSSNYEYDSKQNKIRDLITYYDETGAVSDTLDLKFEYEYNADGTVKKYTDFNRKTEDGYYYIVYEYDSAGNKIEESNYEFTGTLTGKLSYEYDSAGNKIKEASYGHDGQCYYEFLYEYDSQNRLIADSFEYYSEDLKGVNMYSYDEKGNLVRWYNTRENFDCETTYEYDSNGNCTKEINRNKEENSDIFREYDSKGNCIKEETIPHGSSTPMCTYTWEYDDNGNNTSETYYDMYGAEVSHITYEYIEMN